LVIASMLALADCRHRGPVAAEHRSSARRVSGSGAKSLTDLLGDNGSRLHAAAEAAAEQPGSEPSDLEILAPVPAPPSIRDFMAFEEHMVTGSAAIGLTFDPLWYDLGQRRELQQRQPGRPVLVIRRDDLLRLTGHHDPARRHHLQRHRRHRMHPRILPGSRR
jgi:hypothetical protein